MSEPEVEQSGDEEQQPEEFLNRAARRAAKSKKAGGGAESGVSQPGSQPHGRGTVATRRQQFGNRRTG
ncbi:hypothetical protein GCM10010172_84480 [Paractinoplanes ferrugineus]|uniref:Uncharacterized protein n=1 Tax=Paractinoplanes ferrugineus TaxID=113564 RepID=A0A919IZ27_9ACTN|nr:hypothetical protein [Actinoplanes ferrugineus]GIE10769.1 hypothetical protein Afe05nite_26090 [Actinoplanes ferrugineus]